MWLRSRGGAGWRVEVEGGETVNYADSGRAGLEFGNCNSVDFCSDGSHSGACRQVKVWYLRQISNSD